MPMEKDLNTIIQKQQLVISYIDQLQIIEAGCVIKEMLTISGLTDLINKVDAEIQTFRYLLQYMKENLPDPNKDFVISKISEQLLSLSDLAVRNIKSKDSSDYYYSILRFKNYRNERLSDILKKYGEITSELSLMNAAGEDTQDLRKNKESTVEQLFNALFTSLGDEKSIHELGKFLLSEYADSEIGSISLSALTLSLLQYYDKSKLEVLIDVFERKDNPKFTAKALVGIILTLSKYPQRILNDKSITARLALWQDSLDYYNKLRQALRILVGVRDTERVTSKINEEVIPELLKLRPEIMRKLQELNTSDIDEDTLDEFRNNPEWEELLEESGLNNKLQELSEMQNDGADIMMMTFAKLKQFPFFDSGANWFLPFNIEHTLLSVPPELSSLIDYLNESGNMICDSDMYSLALALSQMPEMQRKMLISQLKIQQDQLNESIKDNLNPIREFDSELQKFTRDLYRFFKLFRKKEGLNDPFTEPLKFYEFPIIGDFLKDNDILDLIAEFYFKRGYYKEALPLFKLMAEDNKEDSVLYEKLGFCYQSIGNLQDALEAYLKSSLLKTPGPWLTKKLAFIYKSLGKIDEAISSYRHILEMESENINVLLNLAHLLVEKKEYSEALQHYYHANYLQPSLPKIMRAIGWVELLSGNYSKSLEYFQRIINQQASANDYLNAGHAYTMLNNKKEAINFYRLAADKFKTGFKSAFLDDIKYLTELGLSKTDALLMLEATLN